MSKRENKGLVPKRRFPEFRDKGEWTKKLLGELISTVTPPKKLLTSSYLATGRYPIIDQSQSYICGWTNDESAVVDDHFPLIIFGDHTCVLKLVDQPFVQGADGIKIFKTKNPVETEFLYQSLQCKPLAMEQYKRHFSLLKEREVAYPDRKTGEQKKIADCLASIDDLITAQNQKINALKLHKKGLIQQLFPAEGETVPVRRFPHFRDKGEWIKQKVSDLLEKVSNPVEVNADNIYREIGIRSHGKGIFHKDPISGDELGTKRVFWVEEDAFVVNIVFAWELAVANTTEAEIGMIASHRFPMYKARGNRADTRYMKYFFLTEKGKELLWIASPGGAGRNKTLGQKDFENLEFLVPKFVEEQKRIADCLASIDELITAQTNKLESLVAHKQGLMGELFPAVDEVDA